MPLAPFHYFGGKSLILHLYPPPLFDVIIEPFAGSAAYSLFYLHRCKRVILVEKAHEIAEVWRFLLSDEAAAWIEQLPPYARIGDKVEDYLPNGAPEGLRYLAFLFNFSGKPRGGKRIHSISARTWNLQRGKALRFARDPAKARIELIEGDFAQAPQLTATWFIDPPYLV